MASVRYQWLGGLPCGGQGRIRLADYRRVLGPVQRQSDA